ncbi:MAG: hypothetical protein QGG64_16535 [Candidatus Latescibacteria bacterium]|nr:hypothetical protein [Candidatus Latescibacterota bacterium]
MRHRRRRPIAALLDTGEGFIDVLFLLLTFFIIQNVWQTHMANLHNRFVHAQKLNFIKAAAEEGSAPNPADERFLQIIIGKTFVQFDKGGISTEEQMVFQARSDLDRTGIERTVFLATQKSLHALQAEHGFSPNDILVRLYFERDATVTYTVGVYDALNRNGFKTVQWGLESQKKRF